MRWDLRRRDDRQRELRHLRRRVLGDDNVCRRHVSLALRDGPDELRRTRCLREHAERSGELRLVRKRLCDRRRLQCRCLHHDLHRDTLRRILRVASERSEPLRRMRNDVRRIAELQRGKLCL